MSSTASPSVLLRLYLGTYTLAESRGIYSALFNQATGEAGPVTLAVETAHPSFLAVSSDARTLYATEESASTVKAFAIAPDGALRPLNSGDTGGLAPCDVAVHPTAPLLFIANYNGGSVASFTLHPDGRIGARATLSIHSGSSVHPNRQTAPHAHGVTLSPDGRFLLVPDLGLDHVKVYAIALPCGSLHPHTPDAFPTAPGAGPRHAAFSRDGRHVYLINELANTVVVARYDPAAASLTTFQTIPTLPAGWTGDSATAEIVVHPGDRFVYGSNRGHDSIAVFARDPLSGLLTLREIVPTGGSFPRNFFITPNGLWLLAGNEKSDRIAIFALDPDTGRLFATGRSLPAPRVACIVATALDTALDSR